MRGIVRVDPLSGAQSIVTQAGNLDQQMVAVAFESGGRLLIANGNGGNIVRVDVASGTQTILASGGDLNTPKGVTVAPNGDVYATDQANQKVIRINPTNGAQTVVASAGLLQAPIGVAVSGTSAYVADGGAPDVVKIDLTDSNLATNQSQLSPAGDLLNPQGLAVGPNGDLFVASLGAKKIVQVNATNGTQTVFAQGAPLDEPQSVAFDSSGDVLVGDSQALGTAAVIRINFTTKAQSAVAQGSNLADVRGIAVDTTPSATPTSPPDNSVTTTVTAKKTQRALKQKGILIDVTCPQEACTATVAGTISVPRASASKAYKLKQVSKSLTAGKKVAIKLKFTKKVTRAVKRALRARKKVSAKVTVSARDAAGNSTSKSLKIKIKK